MVKGCAVKRCEPVSGKKSTKWAVKGRAGIESQDVQKGKLSEPVSGKKGKLSEPVSGKKGKSCERERESKKGCELWVKGCEVKRREV